MAIEEIIEIGKRVALDLETRAREYDFKSFEHDEWMRESAEVGRIVLQIESCLHVPGVKDKFDYREDIDYYWNLLEGTADADKRLEILKIVGKDVKNTLLWAKKLSWLGDWDLNYDGLHTQLSISFVPHPEVKNYDVPRFYFQKGERITNQNYKLEIKTSESDFSNPHWIKFSDDWENIEFDTERRGDWLCIRAAAFTWDKAKFAGVILGRHFYAVRTTEFFGMQHTVYYSAGY